MFLLIAGGAPLLAKEKTEEDEYVASCIRYATQYEKENRIPLGLLNAIAVVESGRWSDKHKRNLPWPWVINVGGKGYFFPSKDAAIQKVKSLQKQGQTVIDVGCMQVNLHYHGHHFKNLEEAFEPQTNIAYAASFLRDNYREARSWMRAAGYYHSRTPSLSRRYSRKVLKAWDALHKLHLKKIERKLKEYSAGDDVASLQ